MNIIKETSFEYGKDYQLIQAEKYRNRDNNHWKNRIELAQRLIDRHVLSRIENKIEQITAVDIGCSIGTFAIEFAKSGYQSYGIDFDNSALDIARQLAKEENVSPEFICGDVSNWSDSFPNIDIAMCFDIFEHLHDDELGSLLTSIRRQMSKDGSLVFHTFPTQYDYIFFGKFRYPLLPFTYFASSKFFNVIVKIYSRLLDIGLLLKKGVTYKESIKKYGHCNPTTIERLTEILHRAGYEIKFIESSNLYDFKYSIQQQFSHQSISHRSIYGVAVPKLP
jgi:SAM-dependent methyltransferase